MATDPGGNQGSAEGRVTRAPERLHHAAKAHRAAGQARKWRNLHALRLPRRRVKRARQVFRLLCEGGGSRQRPGCPDGEHHPRAGNLRGRELPLLRDAHVAEAVQEALTTKMQYLQTIREAIAKFQSTAQERYGYIMEVKILLSIDRGKITSKESALEQIDDVLQMQREHPDLVVGIDVCGNPSKPTVVPYLIPALLDRKEAFQQLPITFHTAEIRDDEESYLIIDNIRQLNIRRLGHVCFLPDECRKKLLSSSLHEDGGSIGIELCPTSNQITRELDDLGGHHFLEWWRQSEHILLSINTDDTGLFSCDLSSEVYDLAKAFKLTKTDIVDIQRQALRSSFHPEKERLLRNFEERLSLANKLAALNTCEASCLENDAKRLKA
eukprot:TRINITY_DN21233_c0_g4_i1.p1 TRINITY_DN21233_c0_g4~~TRINITY_DN21233_c0_g4_i1.p1  ORF type:complete len:423 (+),score=68.61 TRINITY_DN21233_c0_g4_i1:125-1270(+)